MPTAPPHAPRAVRIDDEWCSNVNYGREQPRAVAWRLAERRWPSCQYIHTRFLRVIELFDLSSPTPGLCQSKPRSQAPNRPRWWSSRAVCARFCDESWRPLVYAAKIKSMKTPDGADVFPRAENVGRALAPKLLSMDSVRFA